MQEKSPARFPWPDRKARQIPAAWRRHCLHSFACASRGLELPLAGERKALKTAMKRLIRLKWASADAQFLDTFTRNDVGSIAVRFLVLTPSVLEPKGASPRLPNPFLVQKGAISPRALRRKPLSISPNEQGDGVGRTTRVARQDGKVLGGWSDLPNLDPTFTGASPHVWIALSAHQPDRRCDSDPVAS